MINERLLSGKYIRKCEREASGRLVLELSDDTKVEIEGSMTMTRPLPEAEEAKVYTILAKMVRDDMAKRREELVEELLLIDTLRASTDDMMLVREWARGEHPIALGPGDSAVRVWATDEQTNAFKISDWGEWRGYWQDVKFVLEKHGLWK